MQCRGFPYDEPSLAQAFQSALHRGRGQADLLGDLLCNDACVVLIEREDAAVELVERRRRGRGRSGNRSTPSQFEIYPRCEGAECRLSASSCGETAYWSTSLGSKRSMLELRPTCENCN